MMLAHIRKETVVEASPQAVFDIVADLTRHPELAGSGEVLSVRKVTEGPVDVGTRFQAREDVPHDLGRWSHHRKFVSESEVLVCDPPHTFSWRSAPPGPKPRRLQWWFRLSPEGRFTRVVHEMEMDLGPVVNFVFRAPFRWTRARRIEKGMERTLDNLRRTVKAAG